MKIIHKNKAIQLTNTNFLSEGGEGKVYKYQDTLFKIFHKKPIPEQKIEDLRALKHSQIMRPLNTITDTNKKYIGFSMNYAENTIPLCKLFTNTFWKANNINANTIIKLIKNFEDIINFIHQQKCLIVDVNEFNFLVRQSDYTMPYFIDVDSYQSPNYPASAIMNSIRDWHSPKFSENTDWFSFAILACQLLVGIHPFKGKHPSYPKKDLKNRMLNNVSIFNSKTKVPISARDFSYIPSEYKLWFIDLFEKGNRSLPPSKIGTIQITAKQVKPEEIDKKLIIKLLSTLPIGHSNYYCWKGQEIITKNNIPSFMDNGDIILSEIIHGQLIPNSMYFDCKADIQAKELLYIDNMLFAVNKNKISEVIFTKANNKLLTTLGKSWDILPYAHKVLNGFLYQNILGKSHLSFFYKNNGKTNCSILAMPELDQYKIVDGKYENRIAVIIGFKNGKYDEFIIKLDESYSKYSIIKNEDIDNQDVNMTVLDKGLGLILEDGKLKMFTNRVDDDIIKVIEDENLNSNMRLCHKGNSLQFVLDDKVYSIRMKGE